MARRKITQAERFKKEYTGYLSPRTLEEYGRILSQIEKETLVIRSKSKYLQVKSVLQKCHTINLSVKYTLKPWSRREDRTKENIIDKLVSEVDFNRLVEALPKTTKGDELRLAMKLAYHGGLRLAEVLELKKKDLYIDEHVKLIFKGKGGKTRKSYLPLQMSNEMNQFSGLSLSPSYIKTTLKRIANKVGLNISFHSLRHTFASNLLKNGVKLNRIQALLGHQNIATTSIYLHALDDVDIEMIQFGY